MKDILTIGITVILTLLTILSVVTKLKVEDQQKELDRIAEQKRIDDEMAEKKRFEDKLKKEKQFILNHPAIYVRNAIENNILFELDIPMRFEDKADTIPSVVEDNYHFIGYATKAGQLFEGELVIQADNNIKVRDIKLKKSGIFLINNNLCQ